MKMIDSINTLKALADQSRLMIVNALLEKPQYVEELAQRFGLSASTISFHLKKLEKAGLILGNKQQYYVIYQVNPQVFDMPLRTLISIDPETSQLEQERIDLYRQKILNTFFSNGRLEKIPTQHKKMLMVLEVIASSFDVDLIYTEKQVNDLITVIYDDHCTIRRLLVDEGYMSRDQGLYRLLREPSGVPDKEWNNYKRGKMLSRKEELKKAYKEREPEMGIFQIRNIKNGKVFIGSSQNLPGMYNRYSFQLKRGCHRNRDLQNDWNEYGEDSFVFETLDTLKAKTDPGWKPEADLDMLCELWLEKIQPFGERGYNKKGRKF